MGILSGCSQQQVKCPEIVQTEGIIAQGATLQTLSTEFSFTEGPAADDKGNVYFTDQPNNRIMVYTTEGKVETFLEPAGRANGMYFDNDGYLLACADENGEVWKIDMKTKTHEVLAHEYNGARLNATNDLWVRPDGGIYVSDPFYARTWWTHTSPTQDGEHVYYIDPKTGELTRVLNNLLKPNGLIGTPDGKTLFVSDINGRKIYQYDIQKDGSLTNPRVFCQTGADGMTLDCCGNLYLAANRGIAVFNKDGQQIESFRVPAGWTANVTFGGPDNKTLFITAEKGLYSLQMNVCGAQ